MESKFYLDWKIVPNDWITPKQLSILGVKCPQTGIHLLSPRDKRRFIGGWVYKDPPVPHRGRPIAPLEGVYETEVRGAPPRRSGDGLDACTGPLATGGPVPVTHDR